MDVAPSLLDGGPKPPRFDTGDEEASAPHTPGRSGGRLIRLPPARLRTPRRPLGAAGPALLLLAACSHVVPSRFVDARVVPPERAAAEFASAPPPESAPPSASAPSARGAPGAAVEAPRSLADLVDLALARDPTTRAAWHDARSAAAQAGSRWNLYLPTIDPSAALVRSRSRSVSGRPPAETDGTVGVNVTWLLLDLGVRSALVEESDRLLAAARLAEQATVANLVLQVQQTYFQYLGARALVQSEAAAVKQAQTSLAAAEGRRRAGVGTIAEVLQARTALSQVQLSLQQIEGQALALRGALATLARLPPTVELEVGELPARVEAAEAQPRIDALLAAAAARNPDLARTRAIAGAADARSRAASRAWLPTIAAQGSVVRTIPVAPESLSPFVTWSGGIVLRVPLFQGLQPAYDALAAREDAQAAHARADATAQQVALDVWTSYQGVVTAVRRVDTARDLVESARANADVATGRYQQGVGSILDLLTAQAALENARAQDVSARSDYLVALARLARASGRLELPPRAEPPAPEGKS